MKIVKTNKSVSGTSFHGDIITASFNELVKAFGTAQCHGGDKSMHDWQLECQGIVFTIYDWKEIIDPASAPDREFDWHIGAFDAVDSANVRAAVNTYIAFADRNSDYEDRLEHLLGHFSDPDEAAHYADMDPANWPEGVPAMPSEPEFDSAGFSISDRGGDQC